jgi:hypothetical protein
MRSTSLVPVLLAACLVTGTACSDSTAPTSTTTAARPTAPAPSLVTFSGVIHRLGTTLDQAVLTTPDGSQLVLAGSEVPNLMHVENAEVDVRGTLDGQTLLVADFLVRRVGGTDVMDGILTMLPGDANDTEMHAVTYGITLADGSIIPLIDPPQELLAYVGERVWVSDPVEGQPTAFGVIGSPTT